MLKNMGPFLVLVLLAGCGEKKSIEFGKTTKAALIEAKGEPLREEEIPSGEILTFEKNEKIQVNNGIVTTQFRTPEGDERTVLFWKHKFRECETTEKILNDEALPEVELSCPAEGASVIYFKGTGKVLRVSKYEAP